jgi:hypothetical protein
LEAFPICSSFKMKSHKLLLEKATLRYRISRYFRSTLISVPAVFVSYMSAEVERLGPRTVERILEVSQSSGPYAIRMRGVNHRRSRRSNIIAILQTPLHDYKAVYTVSIQRLEHHYYCYATIPTPLLRGSSLCHFTDPFGLNYRDGLLRRLSLQTFRPTTFRLREVFFAECTCDVAVDIGHCYAKHIVFSAIATSITGFLFAWIYLWENFPSLGRWPCIVLRGCLIVRLFHPWRCRR